MDSIKKADSLKTVLQLDSLKKDSIAKSISTKNVGVAIKYRYKGKIGQYPIHLEFTTTKPSDCPRGGSMFEGWYYYDSSGENNKMRIDGGFCGASITFSEYNADDVNTGLFSGLWGGNQIDGNWTGNGHSYELHLISID